MSGTENNKKFESLEELEDIEGNYYKMDLFVANSLVLFTVWVFMAEKDFVWTLFLGGVAILFFIRGLKNWRKKTLPTREARSKGSQNDPS